MVGASWDSLDPYWDMEHLLFGAISFFVLGSGDGLFQLYTGFGEQSSHRRQQVSLEHDKEAAWSPEHF